MSNKLQELTERLYTEGLSKGQQQAEQILADANAKAGEIIAQAKAEAEKIIAQAEAQAADLAAKSASDVKIASSQALDVTKAAIQNVIMTKSVDAATAKLLSSEEFIKEIIMAVAKAYSTEHACDLAFVVPEHLKNLESYITGQVADAIGAGVEMNVSKSIKAGFNVGPKNGTYYVSFSDETFNALIREYLRPATRKVLFGE